MCDLVEAVHSALDTDGDGNISEAEVQTVVALLDVADKNGDGDITKEEFVSSFVDPVNTGSKSSKKGIISSSPNAVVDHSKSKKKDD